MNIARIAEGIDFSPLLSVLEKNKHLFDAIPFRTEFPDSPHREVHDIILRCPEEISADVIDDRFCVNYPAMEVIRKDLYPYLSELMLSVAGVCVGRLIVSLLEPGAMVYPHADEGAACNFHHRFHMVLQAEGGCYLIVGDEQVEQKTGEVYWFNNNLVHSVRNDGETQRVVIIVDLELLNVGEYGGE